MIANFGVDCRSKPADSRPDRPVLIGPDGRDYGLEIMCIDRSAAPPSTGEFIVDSLSVTTMADGDLATSATAGYLKEWTGATGAGSDPVTRSRERRWRQGPRRRGRSATSAVPWDSGTATASSTPGTAIPTTYSSGEA